MNSFDFEDPALKRLIVYLSENFGHEFFLALKELENQRVSIHGDLPETIESIADAIRYAFVSPNEADRNLEPANVVDALMFSGRKISKSIDNLADAIREIKG